MGHNNSVPTKPPQGDNTHDTAFFRRLALLSQDSWRTLFRFKSFFMLIFLIFWADRVLRPLVKSRTAGLRLTGVDHWGMDLSEKIFLQLPAQWIGVLVNPDTLLILLALFLFKQMISLLPSSDMRRMHRQERDGFGLWQSMLALSWRQVMWDALALGVIGCVAVTWVLAAYGLCRMAWIHTGESVWALVFVLWAGGIVPQVLAGLSFSSKLAVIRHGGSAEKLHLMGMIYTNTDMMVPVWGFFAMRLFLETLLVAVIPGIIVLTLTIPWLRILLAGLLATPVYAFLKMISFKFFLDTYSHFDIVRAEYAAYFGSDAKPVSKGPQREVVTLNGDFQSRRRECSKGER